MFGTVVVCDATLQNTRTVISAGSKSRMSVTSMTNRLNIVEVVVKCQMGLTSASILVQSPHRGAVGPWAGPLLHYIDDLKVSLEGFTPVNKYVMPRS